MDGVAFFSVFLLLFDITIVISFEYGPSFEFLIPEEEGRRIKEIYLESYFPSYSIILPLANNSSSSHSSVIHPNGEFTVHAPPEFGIMVVIQTMRLRTTTIYENREDTTFLKCRDYLRLNAGNQSSQVCGHVVKYSKEGSPSGLLGRRVFITHESQLSVALHVDRHLAENDYGGHETIALELVITAFKECPKTTFISQWIKLTGSSQIKSCSPSEDRICIFVGSYCDGVMNCGVKGPLGHIGYDEENCKPFRTSSPSDPPLRLPPPITFPTTTERSYIGVNKPYSPPTAGAVVSPIHLILIFSTVVLVLFGACTWLAKANEKKFQHTMYRFNTMRRQRRNNRQRTPGDETMGRLPTAPPVSNSNTLGGSGIEGEGITGAEEPPPYADLFPSAPPISTSSTNH